MASTAVIAKPLSATFSDKSDYDEPMSKQLEILMERRRQEEVRKARYYWALLRNSIRNTIVAVKESDEKNINISHGIHHHRKLNHNTTLKQVICIKERDEYLTTDGQNVRLYMLDGRLKKTYTTEEPVDHISYCSQFKEFVGWVSDGDELFLMDSEFEIISQSRAPSKIVLAEYNKHTHEYITVGPGYFVTWQFRYGARHMIPRKMNRTDFKENNMFSHMVLEGTASRVQKIFLSIQNSCVVYNVFDGTLVCYRKNLHERNITAMTFFNPLKYLVTGALDGTIKIWDSKWHVQVVFVGHTSTIVALDIYPHGSAIISASMDQTIRVWNLDTSDEVDRAILDETVTSLSTTLDYDMFFTYSGKTVDIWKIQHLYHIHTSVGQRIIKIEQTTHPNYTSRSVIMCRDSTVRLVSPVTGDVITSLLLSPNRGMVDVAYVTENELMFCALANGDILKCRTDTNPCRVVAQWQYEDPEKEACDCLCMYEYIVDIQLRTDTWGAAKNVSDTKTSTAEDEVDNVEKSDRKRKNMNRTLLVGGRKDGYICVYNWDTGEVDFKIDAHGSKGVLAMIANAKNNQLISTGRDNVIKVWRVYPYVQESLGPLMSFFCAHLPVHMSMIKTTLCVAFQDHGTATYSIVMYNLRDRNRYDHSPGDDHTESITGVTACPRLKLYASSSLDGTLRIWNETNTLVRLLKLKSIAYSVRFCNAHGDLLVGIGNHLYKIPHYAYMPKSYMFRMVSMKFLAQKAEKPMAEDSELTQVMSKTDISRLKKSHSSFKYSTYADILTAEEEEEINREQLIREKEFALLLEREQELNKIRDGDLISKKKPKSTNMTKSIAFNQYMKMFYDKPKPKVRKDDPFPEDTLKQILKEPEPTEKEEWCQEKEPVGFFPPASEAVRPMPPDDSPLKAAYPITPNGYVPNSILIKLLWPQEAKNKMAKLKPVEWTLPTFSNKQLQAIEQLKQEREEAEKQAESDKVKLDKWPSLDSWHIHPDSRTPSSSHVVTSHEIKSPTLLSIETASKRFKSVSFDSVVGEKDEVVENETETERQVTFSDEDRVLDIDWGEDGDGKCESPNIYEEESKMPLKDIVNANEENEKPTNKFAEHITKTPTLKLEEEEISQAQITSEKSELSQKSEGKQPSDLSSKKQEIKPVKPIKKLVSRPPPPLPEVKAPKTPEPPKTVVSSYVKIPTPIPSPSPSLHHSATPMPGFINQFMEVLWFKKFFPNENSVPKPWVLDNFVSSLLKLLGTVEFADKVVIVDALLLLHAQTEFADSLSHSVIKAVSAILNHQKNYPSCMIVDQKKFIIASLKAFQKFFKTPSREFITEMLVQFLDGDKEVRFEVISILSACGLLDQNKFLPKELDSWDIWNVEEEDRKTDLQKMCQQWLDRWMTSYKLHLQDTIERMTKGQNIHGRLTRDQLKSKTTSSTNKGILRRSVGIGADGVILEDQETVTTLDEPTRKSVTVTFDKPPDPSLIDNATFIDALNYFCDMTMEKNMEAMRAPGKRLSGTKENVVQAKNTVLVLPKIPHKPSLVRLGETHTSQCRPHRETNLHVDYRLLPVTSRGHHPLPGQISGFVNSINLPMKQLMLNPFRNAMDDFDARFQEPILITLKSAQKYFIPSQSIVSQEIIPVAL